MSHRGEKVRVLIPTTAGLVEVLLLTEEDPAIGRSVACIGGSTRTADIDADYNAFVARATGVVERLFGHPCYRLDISGRIDAGSSWQLGVLTAHALRAAGRLACEGEDAKYIVWATGSVRSVDLTVSAVDHVGEKLAAVSWERLEHEVRAGRSVLVAVPEANAADIAPELRTKLATLGIDTLEVGSVEPLWERLCLSSAVLQEQAQRRRQLRLRTAIAAFMGALAIVAAAAAWTALRQSLEAERRLVIALDASEGITRMATDFKERFGVTTPQLSLRLKEADQVLQRLSSAQTPGMSFAEFKRTLARLSEGVGDTPEFQHRKARTLMALSENYATLGRTGEQVVHATAARRLLGELASRADGDPEWQRDLGRAYVAEGDALRAQGKGEAAFAAYSEALRLRTGLAGLGDQDPEHTRELASAMGRIGDVLAVRGDYDAALARFGGALQLLERLAVREPNQPKWRRDVAAAHGRIGEALAGRGDAGRALQSFRESERILAELVSTDPNNTHWMRELSIWKERIGGILLDRGDLANALTGYQASLQLRKRLTESDPNHVQWQLDLAYARGKVADALGTSDLQSALALRREAHALVMRVASGADISADLRRALSGSHVNLGVNLQQIGSAEAAGTHFQAALEQAEYLVASDPANAEWRDDLAVALEWIGRNLGARGEIGSARAKLERAGSIREELVALYPGRRSWRRSLAIVQRELSLVLELERDIEGALGLASEALRTAQELAASDLASRTLQRDLASSHQRVAELLLKQEKAGPAVEHLEKALAILDAEPEAAAHAWQWSLVTTRVRLADAFLAGAQPRLAEEQLRRVRDAAERLHRADPGNTAGARALYTIYARIGDVEQAAGRAKQALIAMQRCHDLVAALVARDRSNKDWQYDLALTHRGIGDILATLPGKGTEALSAYGRAVRLLEPLSHASPTSLALQRTLAEAHSHIATLAAQRGDREAELRALRTGLATMQRIVAAHPGDAALTERLAWFEKAYRERSNRSM